MQPDLTDQNIIAVIQKNTGHIIEITNDIFEFQWRKGFHYQGKSTYLTSEDLWDFDRGTDGPEYQLHQLSVMCDRIIEYFGLNLCDSHINLKEKN